MSWTPEIETLLAQLWREGLSASQIGRRIGVTKGQVIGKVHRMHLPPRPAPVVRSAPPERPKPIQSTTGCQYLTKTPKQGGTFCGAPRTTFRISGKPSPFCVTHHDLCYFIPKAKGAVDG